MKLNQVRQGNDVDTSQEQWSRQKRHEGHTSRAMTRT